MRVLVFGDSITQGYWDTDGGWVERLRKHHDTIQASDLQKNDEPSIFNLGISADNSKDILNRIESETSARTRGGNKPVVIIQIGVNDSSMDEEDEDKSVRVSIEDYGNNLRQIIQKIKPVSSKLILVGLSACDETKTTPVSWGNYHYTNASIKRYEDRMKDIAEELSTPFIPVFDDFKRELDNGKDYLPDGLHPNNEGHQFMYETIKSRLGNMLDD